MATLELRLPQDEEIIEYLNKNQIRYSYLPRYGLGNSDILIGVELRGGEIEETLTFIKKFYRRMENSWEINDYM